MKSKEAIERHIKELLSEMTVEEKLDELDPNIMGIDWEKSKNRCAGNAWKTGKRRADARVYNALQKYAKEQTRLGIPFCSMRRPCMGCIAVTQRSFHSS